MVSAFNTDVIIFFLTGNSADNFTICQRFDKNFIGKNIQFLLVFTLNICIPRCTQNVHKSGFVHFVIDNLGSKTNGIAKSGKYTGGIFKYILYFNDIFSEQLVDWM